MKIYVITKGNYSDYHICSVTTDKEKAETLAKKFTDRWEEAQVEEYDTDGTDEFLRHKNLYFCWYQEDDKRIGIEKRDFRELYSYNDLSPRKTKYGMYVYVLANDEDMALKKASDKFAKFRAEEMEMCFTFEP